MNDLKLKEDLRLLADQGWFVAKITDELVESLVGRREMPPSGTLKEHFLLSLRARINQIASPRYSGFERK